MLDYKVERKAQKVERKAQITNYNVQITNVAPARQTDQSALSRSELRQSRLVLPSGVQTCARQMQEICGGAMMALRIAGGTLGVAAGITGATIFALGIYSLATGTPFLFSRASRNGNGNSGGGASGGGGSGGSGGGGYYGGSGGSGGGTGNGGNGGSGGGYYGGGGGSGNGGSGYYGGGGNGGNGGDYYGGGNGNGYTPPDRPIDDPGWLV